MPKKPAKIKVPAKKKPSPRKQALKKMVGSY